MQLRRQGPAPEIAYGNGATTTYTYDPDTFRLTELQTTRPGRRAAPGPSYTYDPVGNITRLTDAAQQTIFFDNQVVSPSADYTYDPIYRLIRATGREHISQAAARRPLERRRQDVGAAPADGQAMRNYTETYAYDPVGNFTASSTPPPAAAGPAPTPTTSRPAHRPTTSSPRPPSAPPPSSYTYDANGNIISMPHLPLMQWDWKDQLQATASHRDGRRPGETTYYPYRLG